MFFYREIPAPPAASLWLGIQALGPFSSYKQDSYTPTLVDTQNLNNFPQTGPMTSGPALVVDPQVLNSVRFTGVNTNHYLLPNFSFPANSGAASDGVSFCFVAKLNNDTHTQYVTKAPDTPSWGVDFGKGAPPGVDVGFSCGPGRGGALPRNLTTGETVFISYSFLNDGSLLAYINGYQYTWPAGSFSVPPSATNKYMEIGGDSEPYFGSLYGFDGWLSHVAWFAKSLNATQHLALYALSGLPSYP